MKWMNKILVLVLLVVLISNVVPYAHANSDDFAYLREEFLNQDPDPAEPGEALELRWKVEKYGLESINDVEYKLVIDYPFSFDPVNGPYQELGNWWVLSDREEYQTLYYKLRVDDNALEGEYDIKLLSRYDEQPAWSTTEYTIRVGEPTKPTFVVGNLQTSPTKLTSDTDEAQLSVDIQNIGKENADVVIASLDLPEGFHASYGYSDRSTLGTIASGMGKVADFFVDVDEDVTSGIHTGTLRLSYTDAGDSDDEYETVEIPLDIPIKRKPHFEIVNMTVTPSPLVPGSTGTLLFGLHNVGEKDATSVSIKIYKESSQPFDFNEKTNFVGTLEPGDSGQAQLSFTVDNEASFKEYIFDIEIRSVDGDQVIIQEETVSVSVVEDGSGFGPVMIVIGIGLLIGGYFYYRKHRSRSKKR